MANRPTTEANEYSDQRSASKRDLLRRKHALSLLLESPDGRFFLWWWLERTHMLNTPFSVDPCRTAFSCGEQNIGLQLWAELQAASPKLFLQLIMENTSDKELKNDRPSDADSDSAARTFADADA